MGFFHGLFDGFADDVAGVGVGFLAALGAGGQGVPDLIDDVLPRLAARGGFDQAGHDADGKADAQGGEDRGNGVGPNAVVRLAQDVLRTFFGVLGVHGEVKGESESESGKWSAGSLVGGGVVGGLGRADFSGDAQRATDGRAWGRFSVALALLRPLGGYSALFLKVIFSFGIPRKL